MRVTVCELADDPVGRSEEWERLSAHVRSKRSQLLLLPELSFVTWPRRKQDFTGSNWAVAVREHASKEKMLEDMGESVVVGTRPVMRNGMRMNEGFVWTKAEGSRGVHSKYLLPNEEGFWEANWYGRGDGTFAGSRVSGAQIGFLICTELWSMTHARQYGSSGVHVIVNPRTTGMSTVSKWLSGVVACSVVSGCFTMSSNRFSSGTDGRFGGTGWIVDPDGNIIATTSRKEPFVTRDIDITAAVRARETFPRYCLD